MHYADFKSILSKTNGMNLYRGCVHGCIYCDSRSKCYQIKHDFEDIEIKRNAPAMLDTELKKRRAKCVISTGAMCDSYMPFDAVLDNTREALRIIERNGFGLSIQTKSSLILRDMELLKAINKNMLCVVETTFTTYDEALCKKLEPNVASTRERFEMLLAMRGEDIPTIVWISPVLPFINDTKENLRGLLDYCVRAGVKGILTFGFGTTMRDGSREYFYSKLDELFPKQNGTQSLKEKYIETFGNSYSCHSPNDAMLKQIMRETCERHGILYGDHRALASIWHTKPEPAYDQLSL